MRRVPRLAPEARMKVLFTVKRVGRTGGSQGIVRDLALGLLERGHMAVVYSGLDAGPSNSFADERIATTTSLNDLPFVPDVIHAHHHLDAMAAIMTLRGVPAVYCCHGAVEMEKQPRHPRIVRYVAMSPTLKLRMAVESGIDEDCIDVAYNAVDLRRFGVVREPPERPRKALVYRRGFDPESFVGREIRKAVAAAGLEIEFRGIGPGLTQIVHPEEVLPGYDLVFTSGKSAIDAMACGCAVIVLGNTTCGEMVSEANFDRWRRANFCPPVNSPPPSASRIAAEMARYSASEVAATARRLRAAAGLDPYVDLLVSIYQRAIEIHRQATHDLVAENQAATRYLRSLAPWVTQLDAFAASPAYRPRLDAAKAGLLAQIQAIGGTPAGPS
jgi:hypothetical protein